MIIFQINQCLENVHYTKPKVMSSPRSAVQNSEILNFLSHITKQQVLTIERLKLDNVWTYYIQ